MVTLGVALTAAAQMPDDAAGLSTIPAPETIQARIDETEASMLLDVDTKAKVAERLKSALRELSRVNDARLNAEKFQQEAKTAADKAAALRAELEAEIRSPRTDVI
jgi:hypothetical protein